MPDVAGRFSLDNEIARGGIGIIRHGHDADLGRGVAVKVLQERHLSNERIRQRFLEEARIGGQLQHPGIVPVYELGMADGCPFFAMKLIRGETLMALLSARNDHTESLPHLLSVFEAIAQTMAYAHTQGVIHRDLKPANVMVGEFGEVQVVDWGMAKVLGEDESDRSGDSPLRIEAQDPNSDTSKTIDGTVIGTPNYMAPEQARGEVFELDARCDVFGLGAILCEILTGTPPFSGGKMDPVLDASIGNTAPAMRRLRSCGADAELLQIVTDCLAAEPEDRLASANEVAERFSIYRRSIEARAQAAIVQAAEARVRARSTVLLALAAVVVVLIGAGAWWILEREDRRLRDAANSSADELVAAARKAESQAAASGWRRLELWQIAEDAAERAVEDARSKHVEGDRKDAASAHLTVVRELHAQAGRDAARHAKETAMLDRLERVRLPRDESFHFNSWSSKDAIRQVGAYRAAFSDYLDGLDLATTEVAAAVLALSGSIQIQLAAGFDLWALAGHVAPESASPNAEKLWSIAEGLDADNSWRSGLRSLLRNLTEHRAELLALAETADLRVLPVSSVTLLAEGLIAAGERKAAVRVYRVGLAVHLADFSMRFRMGVLSLMASDYDVAVGHLHTVHGLRPEMVAPRHLLGVALSRAGRATESLELFRELVARYPRDLHLRRHLGACQWIAKRWDAAAVTLDGILAERPNHLTALCDRTKLAADRGDLQTAMKLIQRAVRHHPRSVAAGETYVATLVKSGQAAAALAEAQRTAELPDARATNLVDFGRLLIDVRKTRRAIAVFTKAIELSPGLPDAHVYLAHALFKAKRHDEARSRLEQAFALAVGRPAALAEAHIVQAHLYRAAKKPAERLHALRSAVRVDPQHMMANQQLVQLLFSLKRTREAVDQAKLVVLNPIAKAETLLRIGNLLRDAGQFALAERGLRAALEKHGAPRMRFALGSVLMKTSRYAEAASEYRAGLEHRPNYSSACANLAFSLLNDGRAIDGLAILDTAIKAAPDEPNLLNARCILRAHLGLIAAAREDLKTVVKLRRSRHFRNTVADPGRLRQLIGEMDRTARPQREALLGKTGREAHGFAAAMMARQLGMNRRAVGLFDAAMREKPLQSDISGHRYYAACSALRTMTEGIDLSAEESSVLRSQALTWLTTELTRLIEMGKTRALAQWDLSSDLGSVRGEPLKTLPADEQPLWTALWRRFDVARR